MCGIAGILNLKDLEPPGRAQLGAMIGQLHHRGPDGKGFYLNEKVGLAHARLSIIDLAGGDQPIHNENNSINVIFNGEIFNYLELRSTLSGLGHQFYTDSDTEVIVHLYEQYGLDFVHHLNGQFAIALWDNNQKQLVLARDRVGIRPVYYTRARGRLYFASEIKSLLLNSDVTRRLNIQALGEVFSYWSPLAPNTLFEDVYSLPPGHMIVVRNGVQDIRRYWDWRFDKGRPADNLALDEWAQQLKDILIDAVRLRLRADVPVGAYLSGGLDSSVITSFIKHFSDTPLRTFSIGFEDGEFDESPYQKELINYLGTDHTHVLCRTSDIRASFPRAIWHTESTILRTAPVPLMLLSNKVRELNYKVVLTGEGSDEVLGGYDIFKEAKVRRFWARFPESEVRPMLLDRLYPYLKHNPMTGGKLFFKQGLDQHARPYFAHMPRWATTQRCWQFFGEGIKDHFKGWDPCTAIESNLPAEINEWQPLNRDQYVEAHTLLSGYLLNSQGDRMGMANSVEGRFPFLDYRLIEFANRLPARYKIMGLVEKFLLKHTVKELLPESIRVRSKQPYRAPDNQAFFINGQPADYVSYLLGNERIRYSGYFNPTAVEKLVKKCSAGRAIGFSDNMAFVGILSTMLLDEMFIQPASIAGGYGQCEFAAGFSN
jgi:asparagine synthase (glutamine-hydrolysing)